MSLAYARSRGRSGWVYAEFVRHLATQLRTDLALDARQIVIWRRRQLAEDAVRDLSGLVNHSDRGVQYLAIRYPERLADAGTVYSVGNRGDSDDNPRDDRCILKSKDQREGGSH